MDSKITIGITGGIGSGKSMICRIISTLGYPVFYADNEAKALYTESPFVKDSVLELFGNEAYKSGQLNREFLANRIYSNPDLKEKLEAIIHPAVRERFVNWTNAQDSNIVFAEAAILFETGSYKNYSKTILVISPKEVRINRIIKRDGISREEVEARMNNQWSDEKKMELADFVVYNNEEHMLIPQVLELIEKVQA